MSFEGDWRLALIFNDQGPLIYCRVIIIVGVVFYILFIHNILSDLPHSNRWTRFRTRRRRPPCRPPMTAEWTKLLQRCSGRKAGRRQPTCPSWTIPVWQWSTWCRTLPNSGWCSSSRRLSWGKWAPAAGHPFHPAISPARNDKSWLCRR